MSVQKSEYKIPTLAAKYALPSDVGESLQEEIAQSITFMMGQNLEGSLLKRQQEGTCVLQL